MSRRRPTLHDFIEDELLRAPMTIDQVIDAVLDRWRLRLPAHGRSDADPVRLLHRHRGEIVDEALRSLRLAAQSDLERDGRRQPGNGASATALQRLELSLIGEDDVAVDIEIARCHALVKQRAEVELRELQTYTSALVDDINVSRDTNPFRPERFVRALWSGVQQLPLSRPTQAAFLRDAAEPLADALKRAYGAGCQRLEEQGVTPAAYRTILAGSGTGWGSDMTRSRPPRDLNLLRHSMPSRLDELPEAAVPPRPADAIAAASAAAPAPTRTAAPDPQLIELLARLFDAIQTDYGLAPDTVALLQRLQPTALRVALRDPSLLDSYEHPVWRFLDHVAHDIEHSVAGQRRRLLGLCRNLVDHLAAADTHDGQGFAWALERLQAARRHALAQAQLAAAPQIQRLQRVLLSEASVTTIAMALDIGTLDTVPAALMPEQPPGASGGAVAQRAIDLRPGNQVRLYLQGDWRQVSVLWQDDDQELVLLHELGAEGMWALRQSALARLFGEGLASSLRVRSLVRRAAEKVLRAL